jgi:putative MATE family efflux protein
MILFALPIMLTGILQVAYTMADNIVVGRFSDDPGALAAVGSVGTFYNFTMNFLMGIAAGVSVVIAQFFGAGEHKRLARAVHTTVSISLICGIAFTVIALLISRPVLVLLGTKPEILDSAVLYFRIICIGIPASLLYNCAAAVIRSVGDSRTPLIILSTTGLANVALNLVFVIIFKMSVAGVGIATITSQYLSAIAVMLVLIKRGAEPYGFRIRELCVDSSVVSRIMRLGVPAAIQSSMFSISNMLITSAVNTFPTTTVSANTIASNIDGIAYVSMKGFSQSAETFSGQNWGAKKPKRIKRALAYALLQVTVAGLAMCGVVYAFVEPLASLYINPADENYAVIMATVKEIAALLLSTYTICGIMETLSGFSRGLGYSIAPMAITVTAICVLRVVWIYTVFPLEGMNTITGLYISYPVTWTAATLALAVLAAIAFRKLFALEREIAGRDAAKKNETKESV